MVQGAAQGVVTYQTMGAPQAGQVTYGTPQVISGGSVSYIQQGEQEVQQAQVVQQDGQQTYLQAAPVYVQAGQQMGTGAVTYSGAQTVLQSPYTMAQGATTYAMQGATFP